MTKHLAVWVTYVTLKVVLQTDKLLWIEKEHVKNLIKPCTFLIYFYISLGLENYTNSCLLGRAVLNIHKVSCGVQKVFCKWLKDFEKCWRILPLVFNIHSNFNVLK